MFLDNLVQLSTAQAITTGAIPSTLPYDVTGAGAGNAPNMIGGVTASGNALIGFDIGAGDGSAIPELYWNVSTAFVGGTSLQIAIQAAPDNGSNSPGTYVTIVQTAAIPTANLTLNTSGQFQIPEISPDMAFGEAMPRFYRVLYTVVGTYSAGAISANIVLNPSNATKLQNYPSNYIA